MKSCACCGQEFEPPTGEDFVNPIEQDYCAACYTNRCDTDHPTYTACSGLQKKWARSWQSIPRGYGKTQAQLKFAEEYSLLENDN